ncbi:unnamed protein product, partial [Arabidopsis lyrata]
FDFNKVGVFFHFVAINVERNTLIQQPVQRFMIDTSVARNEIDANVYSRVFEILNGKIWMGYDKNLSDLKNLFNANFHACPIAKYEIDTTKWFAENFDGRIDNMSLEGVSDYFKLDVEKYEKQSSYKVVRDCHLHIQVIKVAMGIIQLEALLKKKEKEEKEAKENINENQKKKKKKRN